jgi:hypothetical protein
MRPNASMWQDPDYSATLTLWASLYALAEKLMDDSVKSIVLEKLYDLRHRIWAFGEASGYVTRGTYSRYWTWRDSVTAHHGEFWLSFAD